MADKKNPQSIDLAVPLTLLNNRRGCANPCRVSGHSSRYAEPVPMTRDGAKKASGAMKPFLKGGYGRHTRSVE
jgi:hypothetical protein